MFTTADASGNATANLAVVSSSASDGIDCTTGPGACSIVATDLSGGFGDSGSATISFGTGG